MRHFEIGDRVRHYGQQYDSALDGTATVLEVKPMPDGTYEYRVRVDAAHDLFGRGESRETWWASYHTYAPVPDLIYRGPK